MFLYLTGFVVQEAFLFEIRVQILAPSDHIAHDAGTSEVIFFVTLGSSTMLQ